MKKHEFYLENLDCPNCANKIQNKLIELNKYNSVIVNFNTLKLIIETDELDITEEVVEIVGEIKPEVVVRDYKDKNHCNHNDENDHCSCHDEDDDENDHNHHIEEHTKDESKNKKNSYKKSISKTKLDLYRLLIGIAIMVVGIYAGLPKKISSLCLIIAYIILLFRTGKNAIKLLKSGTIDENLLVTLSCIGAAFIGKQLEGFMVIILYEIGKILEAKAVNNSRKSIANLMDIKPEYANLKQASHEHRVSPEEVNIGDIIVIKQGEKIPLDGKVISGNAMLNVSSLTGESKLKEVGRDDEVLSGSINENGLIDVKVTKKYEDSTVSKILELVENATDKKAKTETFVNKASRIYTPIVLILALTTFLLLPFILKISFEESFYRGLIFLVVSCPCAIVISVPLSYFSGIGIASKHGILIKGSSYLDSLKDIKEIVFDKTGTLTKGEFEVQKIEAYEGYSEDEILEYTALGEVNSNHPIAVSILKKYNNYIDKDRISDFDEVPGKGICYKTDGKTVKIGTVDYAGDEKTNDQETVVYVKIDEKLAGKIILSDTIKEETIDTIKSLKKSGIITKMFTGDNGDIALKIGKEVGVDEVKAEMLPTDKYNELERIIKNYKEKSDGKEKVAFVGDGINDSPVLALADIGISMGGVGSSSAIEASDVVIMTDDLRKIKEAIKISKYTNKIIKENLLFALIVKSTVLILSVFGLVQMWLAVFADVGVTVLAICNTLRILHHRR